MIQQMSFETILEFETSWWPSIYWAFVFPELEWVSERHSVVSSCLRPHGLYSPWNSPGQNTGVGSLLPSPGDLPNPGIKSRFPEMIAQLVKNLLWCRRPWFDSRIRKIPWRRDRLPILLFLGFSCGSAGKELEYKIQIWLGLLFGDTD